MPNESMSMRLFVCAVAAPAANKEVTFYPDPTLAASSYAERKR
jgi:hypothetical protein